MKEKWDMKSSVRAMVAGAAVVVMTASLAACGNNGNDDAGSDAAQDTTTATGSQIPVLEGESARDALKDAECAADGDKWSLTGTLTNDTDEKTTYTVRANVTKESGGGLKGHQSEEFTLEPGDEEEIEIKDFHTEDPEGLTCSYSVRAAKA